MHCELNVVRNGNEAVEYCVIGATLPDVIFLDINMPLLNGIEALKAIRAMFPHPYPPIAMLSTSMSEVMVDRSYQFGASIYIQKPTQFTDLREYILYCITRLKGHHIEPGFVLSRVSDLQTL